AADHPRLGLTAAPADPARRRPHGGFGLAPGRVSASGLGARHARRRSARDQVQAEVMTETRMWRLCLLSGFTAWLAAAAPAHALMAYVSNEKGNTVSVIDLDNWTVTDTIKVGQRPRGIEFSRDGKFVFVAVGDDDTIDVIDTATKQVVDTLPSGPD